MVISLAAKGLAPGEVSAHRPRHMGPRNRKQTISIIIGEWWAGAFPMLGEV
jgi:hypothetical protein